MKFCGRCGTRLGTVCPVCGFTNAADYQFCGECGTRLAGEAVALEVAASEAVSPLPAVPADARALTEAPPPHLEGERRLATVLVADVTGSTDLLERIGTEAWVDTMNQILQLLETQVYRFGGHVDQFRGDGLVAFFGATSAHEDDPERAVLAALAMHSALESHAAELTESQGIELQVRVGVNTGDVIVTSVGDSRLYREDTAMGEAVALAARLESAAEPGTVLVSESTFRLVEPLFEWQPLGEISVKGVSQPIAVFRPLAAQTEPSQAYGIPVPLIGRHDEIRTLHDCVGELYAGRGGIALVSGEKGMGKSFLVSAVRQHLARQDALLAEAHDGTAPPAASLTWLRGRCRSYDQSWPYSVWLSLFRNWLGMRRGEPREEARDRLHREAEALWGDQWLRYFPYLATFLSLPLDEALAERTRHLDAEGLRQQFFPTVRSWVEAMARRGPLVLEFADVQWADTTSLDLLKYCLPECDHGSLLWLIVFRPQRTLPVWEFRHFVETEYPHRVTTVTVPPLTEEQSAEFIDQLIGPEALTVETRDLVTAKAEGNPYYIGELVRSLIAEGTLAQEPGTGEWHLTRAVGSLDLPDSLQNLLLARIDRLAPEERHVLQMAAVVGSVFWLKALQALAGDVAASEARPPESDTLKRYLTALQREQLVDERGLVPELGMEYVFTSNLVRDAAYESLLTAQRSGFHRRVAEYLEQNLSEKALPHFYGVLAHHYCHAGELRKELFYSLLAAEQARGVYANVEALEHYNRALELLDEMERQATEDGQLHAIGTQRFEVLNGRRDVLHVMGDLDGARADAQTLLQLARQLHEDPALLVDALLEQPGVAIWRTRDELDAGFPLAEEALAIALEMGDRRREMQSLVAIAKQRLWVNDPTAWELAQRALELARQLGDQPYEVRILVSMGQVYAWSDHPDRGKEYLEAALPISQALDDKLAEMRLMELIGLQFERSGDYCRLLTQYHQERLRISREIGHRPAEADALMDCGQIQGLYLGDYEGGLALLGESLAIWGGTPEEAYARLRISQIQTAQSRYDEALETLEQVRRVVDEGAVRDIGLAGLRLVAAILFNALGDRDHLHAALELTAQTRQLVMDAPLTRQYEMAAACEAAAAHLRLAGHATGQTERQAHLTQALESSQAALDIYQQFGFVQVIECVSEEILFRHSLALAANGREAESAEYLQRAYGEMMRKHGLIPLDHRFRRTFLENIPLHREVRAAVLAVFGKERAEA
jgi:class 3 adenylate cyclase/tetratricopeptide (TPR) repeat protein